MIIHTYMCSMQIEKNKISMSFVNNQTKIGKLLKNRKDYFFILFIQHVFFSCPWLF